MAAGGGTLRVERMDASTVQLVRAAQDGDRGALESLFARYLPRVREIVALRVGAQLRRLVDLEDIVQEALLKAFSSLQRFEQRSEGGFRNWLASCVECEIRMHVRKERAEKRGGGKVRRLQDHDSSVLLASVVGGPGPSPSQVAAARELAERLELALLSMPHHYREIIVLRNLCEMSYVEIADVMQLGSEQTARKAFSRALQKLKSAVGV